MEDKQRQIMAKALLGQGIASQGADILKLRQAYGRENTEAQMNGKDFPSFEEWAKQFTQLSTK